MPRTPIKYEEDPADLWRRGERIRAMALNPLIEFCFDDYTLTHEEVCEAERLRKEMGLDGD
jgi:hypothetical protein